MLGLLKQLTLPPALVAEVVHAAEQLARTLDTPPRGDVPDVIEEKLRRLGRVYADGVIDGAEYDTRRRALQAQLAAIVPQHTSALQRAQVVTWLQDLPALLDAATAHERRTVLRSVFTEIWVRDTKIHELTPRAEIAPLVASIVRVVCGVADGQQLPHPHITQQLIHLQAPIPFHQGIYGRAA